MGQGGVVWVRGSQHPCVSRVGEFLTAEGVELRMWDLELFAVCGGLPAGRPGSQVRSDHSAEDGLSDSFVPSSIQNSQ